jgi:hypothetical protein
LVYSALFARPRMGDWSCSRCPSVIVVRSIAGSEFETLHLRRLICDAVPGKRFVWDAPPETRYLGRLSVQSVKKRAKRGMIYSYHGLSNCHG